MELEQYLWVMNAAIPTIIGAYIWLQNSVNKLLKQTENSEKIEKLLVKNLEASEASIKTTKDQSKLIRFLAQQVDPQIILPPED